MKTWEEIAIELEENYGVYADWDVRFFECPECMS